MQLLIILWYSYGTKLNLFLCYQSTSYRMVVSCNTTVYSSFFKFCCYFTHLKSREIYCKIWETRKIFHITLGTVGCLVHIWRVLMSSYNLKKANKWFIHEIEERLKTCQRCWQNHLKLFQFWEEVKMKALKIKGTVIQIRGPISKRVFQENKARQIFRKRSISYPLTHTYVCVSGGTKCLFFGKFGVLCFLETSVLRFALLPYYRPKETLKISSKCLLLVWILKDHKFRDYNNRKWV